MTAKGRTRKCMLHGSWALLHRFGMLRLSLLAITAMLATGGTALALPIPGLFNTGVDNAGNWVPPAAGGVPDLHYTVTVSPLGAFTPVTVNETIFPIGGGPWVANNPGSRWIGPTQNFGNGPPGTYIYETQFTLPANTILSTAIITGLWGTDDASADIFLNGNQQFQTSAGFTTLVPFVVQTGFQIGLNTLEFRLVNAGGPTGLRIDAICGYYIPEPATCSVVLGALLLGFVHVRRRVAASRRALAPGCRSHLGFVQVRQRVAAGSRSQHV